MTSRLEQLLKKKQELDSMIQQIKAKETANERKKDTRRKILLGSMVMKRMSLDSDYERLMIKELDKFLTTGSDRDLFNLSLPEK